MTDKQLTRREIRTPSGNAIQNKVQDLRTIFSPEREPIREESGNQSTVKPATLNQLQGHAECSVNFQLNADRCKQLVTESDSDNEFATPPATPARHLQSSKKSSAITKGKTKYIYGTLNERMDTTDNATAVSAETKTQDTDTNTSVSEHLQNLLDQNIDTEAPQTMSIETVLEMFRQLETKYETRIKSLETSRNLSNTTEKLSTAIVDELNTRIEELEIKNKSLRSTVVKLCDITDENLEKIAKMEINQYKRMAVITGLYTEEGKKETIQDIEVFLEDQIGVSVPVDDYFTVGTATPRTKVVIFQNIKDKMLVMQNKKSIQGLQNADKNPIYINDYQSSEALEKRRWQQGVIKMNEECEGSVKIDKHKGKLLVDGKPFKQRIQPPKPQVLLTLSTEELRSIMKMKMNKGPEIEKEGNKFIGFSMPIKTFQEIENAYIKMRLCYPAARHLICAYSLMGDPKESYLLKGYTDDGEHGAGSRLLEFLLANEIEARVVFVARFYSGNKIGEARFDCIIDAIERCVELCPFNDVLQQNQIILTNSDLEEESTMQEDLRQDTTPKGHRVSRGRGRTRGRGRQTYAGATKFYKRQRSPSMELKQQRKMHRGVGSSKGKYTRKR